MARVHAGILAGVVLLLAGCSTPALYNNWKFRQFVASSDAVELPADTTVLARETSFGQVRGSGDFCSYSYRLIVASELPRVQLEAFYSTKSVYDPADGTASLKAVVSEDEESWRDLLDKNPMLPHGQQIYEISIESYTDMGLDLRCLN